MLNGLDRLWAVFFVAVVLVVPAVLVAGLVAIANPDCRTCGSSVALTFWLMGICVHQRVRWVADLSSGRRLAIWLTAMTVGGITAGLGAIAISLLAQITADFALSASGQVTSVFWLVVAIRLAIRSAPVIVVWVVGGVLVRRSVRRRPGPSLVAALRTRVRDWFKKWLSRDWRLVPFYVAAILVSVAALRYILSE